MKASKELFDITNQAIAQASRGVTLDFLRHPTAQMDADLYADTLADMFGVDSPLTVLERTITTTGAAQLLTIDAPALGSPNLGDSTRLVGIDFAFQLNPNNIPRTDITMTVSLLNAAGVSITSREQQVTGNASIVDGSTRQYLRLLCFEQNSTMDAAGAISPQDGKNFSLPRFQRPDPVALAALLGAVPALTVAQWAQLVPSFHQDVAAIQVAIPAGGFAAGVVITATPITIGREEALAKLILSLDENKDATKTSPIDAGRANIFAKFLGE